MMDMVLRFLSVIAVLIGAVSSAFYVRLAYKREKKKDDVWETAVRLMEKGMSSNSQADDFASVYQLLKSFRDDPSAIPLPEDTIKHRRRHEESDRC